MSLGEESRGHRSLETTHSSSTNRGVRESRGHMFQETSHYTSIKCRSHGRRSILTSHSSTRNYGGYVDRSGSRSKDTSHYYSSNQETRVDVEGRGGYRSHTNHYFSHKQDESGRLLTFSRDTVGGDGRFRYRSHNIHSS